ncbi:MAG: hypothetical protein AAFY39_15565, partial [Pseudomonadota bacterium]
MNTPATEPRKVLADELPEARMQEVVEAVGDALKGEAGLTLRAIDPDGSTLATALEKAVKDALAISPVKALVQAWKGLGQVSDLIGPKGPQDDKPRQVTVATHSLKAGFTPHIVIELGKIAEIRKLPVPVTFTLKVEGLIVTVTNRRIVSVAAGRAKPAVTIQVEGVTVFKQKLPTIDLPLEVKPEVLEA